MRDSFDPVDTFNNLIQCWWVIVLIAVIGGLLGFGFSMIQKPLYQAESTIHASIDFTQINFENMVGEYGHPLVFTQYDEDLALQIVERVLLTKRNDAYAYGRELDSDLDQDTFKRNMQIQRYLARWHLRYRHEDPAVAQAIVNYWTEIGMEALRDAQESGRAESFVMVSLVSLADRPQRPSYYHRNTLALAGTAAGMMLGVVVVDLKFRMQEQPPSEL